MKRLADFESPLTAQSKPASALHYRRPGLITRSMGREGNSRETAATVIQIVVVFVRNLVILLRSHWWPGPSA